MEWGSGFPATGHTGLTLIRGGMPRASSHSEIEWSWAQVLCAQLLLASDSNSRNWSLAICKWSYPSPFAPALEVLNSLTIKRPGSTVGSNHLREGRKAYDEHKIPGNYMVQGLACCSSRDLSL